MKCPNCGKLDLQVEQALVERRVYRGDKNMIIQSIDDGNPSRWNYNGTLYFVGYCLDCRSVFEYDTSESKPGKPLKDFPKINTLKKEDRIITDITKEILENISKHKFIENIPLKRQKNILISDLVYEYTRGFHQALKIYIDYAENYSDNYNSELNINPAAHPKTIIENAAYDIIYHSVHVNLNSYVSTN